jgi:hypothetical protein
MFPSLGSDGFLRISAFVGRSVIDAGHESKSWRSTGIECPDVHLERVGTTRFGLIHARKGKSLNAMCNVSLAPSVRAVLERRHAARKSVYVFTGESGLRSVYIYTLHDQPKRMKAALNLPTDAVIHSFRHAFGTRLGEPGADGFTTMRAIGHSSVVVSQKYMHPMPEAMERTFWRLNAANEQTIASLP